MWKYIKPTEPIDPNILKMLAKFNPAVIWIDGIRYDRPKKKYFDKGEQKP